MENDRTVLVNEEKMNTKDILEQAYMELGKNNMSGKKQTEGRCPKCGKPVGAGDMFCGNCGEKIG